MSTHINIFYIHSAKRTILNVFPNAHVKCIRIDEYPITVTITTSDGTLIWKDSQKKLFRKYASNRQQSIQQITQILDKMKMNMITNE